MKLTIADIEQIEDFILNKSGSSQQKKHLRRIEHDSEYKLAAENIHATIQAIQLEGKRMFKANMAKVQERNSSKIKPYTPGEANVSKRGSTFIRVVVVLLLFALFYLLYQYVRPVSTANRFENQPQDSVPVKVETVPSVAKPVEEEKQKTATAEEAAHKAEKKPVVRTITHVIEIDTVIAADQQFDEDKFLESLGGDSVEVNRRVE